MLRYSAWAQLRESRPAIMRVRRTVVVVPYRDLEDIAALVGTDVVLV